MPIGAEATYVHGIAAEHVENAPDYKAALYLLFRTIHMFSIGGEPLVLGYNSAHFDTPMTDACYGGSCIGHYKQLDILDVVYRHFPHLDSHKLSDAHRDLIRKELVGAHGAIQDCLGVSALVKNILHRLQIPLEQLYLEMQEPKVYHVMPIGKHKRKPPKDVPRGWAKWMRENATDLRPDLKRTIDWILDER